MYRWIENFDSPNRVGSMIDNNNGQVQIYKLEENFFL